MSAQASLEDDLVNYQNVSTGHLPAAEHVIKLVDEAYERCRSNKDGRNSQVYPALAEVPSDLFGICGGTTLAVLMTLTVVTLLRVNCRHHDLPGLTSALLSKAFEIVRWNAG